jgi:hypothetical protein
LYHLEDNPMKLTELPAWFADRDDATEILNRHSGIQPLRVTFSMEWVLWASSGCHDGSKLLGFESAESLQECIAEMPSDVIPAWVYNTGMKNYYRVATKLALVEV